MKIVDAGRSSSVVLEEVEPRLREVYRDPESAVRLAYPEELDESLLVEDKEKLFSGIDLSSFPPGDVL